MNEEPIEQKLKAPVLVHCSAGIGRTGVFCAVSNVVSILKLLLSTSVPPSQQQFKMDLKEIVLKMREDRAGMIQTHEQYIFCYTSIIEKVKQILQVIDYKNELWFHKNLEPTAAQQLLETKPHGTFLFRESSVPGFIGLSAVNGKNIFHTRVGVSEKGFSMDSEWYPSLIKLIESNREVLHLPILRQK